MKRQLTLLAFAVSSDQKSDKNEHNELLSLEKLIETNPCQLGFVLESLRQRTVSFQANISEILYLLELVEVEFANFSEENWRDYISTIANLSVYQLFIIKQHLPLVLMNLSQNIFNILCSPDEFEISARYLRLLKNVSSQFVDDGEFSPNDLLYEFITQQPLYHEISSLSFEEFYKLFVNRYDCYTSLVFCIRNLILIGQNLYQNFFTDMGKLVFYCLHLKSSSDYLHETAGIVSAEPEFISVFFKLFKPLNACSDLLKFVILISNEIDLSEVLNFDSIASAIALKPKYAEYYDEILYRQLELFETTMYSLDTSILENYQSSLKGWQNLKSVNFVLNE